MQSDPQKRLKELAEAPLGRLVVKYSWPALVSMTLNALYSVVDRFFIGKGCGHDAMAALTLCMPVMMLFTAIGVWIGVGHVSVISLKLGERDNVSAEKTLGELVALKLLAFLLLSPLVFVFIDPVLRLTGGASVTPEAMALAKTYLKIVLIPNIFSHLAFGLSGAMRSEGAAVKSMMCMVVGFGLNMILDPIFIFGFGMGVEGAAWATNVAMICSFLWVMKFYLRGESVVKLRLSRIRFYKDILTRALSIGLAPFLQQFMGAVINFSMPLVLAMWSASPVAATQQIASLGIFQVTLILFFMPALGLQQGIAPIIGYNWGARNFERVRRTLLLGLALTTVVVTIAAAANILCPEFLARCFTDSKDIAFIRFTGENLRVANCFLWCIGLNVVATTYFQSIGHPATAIFLSMLRQGFCLLPCIWFLPYLFPGNPTLGVWLALPVSDVLAFIATMPPFFLHTRFLYRAGLLRKRSR